MNLAGLSILGPAFRLNQPATWVASMIAFAVGAVASIGLLFRMEWARRSLIGALALTAITWVGDGLRHHRHVVGVQVTRVPVSANAATPDSALAPPDDIPETSGLRLLGTLEMAAIAVFAGTAIAILMSRRVRNDCAPGEGLAA